MTKNRNAREVQKAIIAVLGIVALSLAFLCTYLLAPIWLLAAMGLFLIAFMGAIMVAVGRAICYHSRS